MKFNFKNLFKKKHHIDMSDIKARKGILENTIIYTSDKNPNVQMILHCISNETLERLKRIENKILKDVLNNAKSF